VCHISKPPCDCQLPATSCLPVSTCGGGCM
jgi:hypothetical protein